jgi:hypothetical protein
MLGAGFDLAQWFRRQLFRTLSSALRVRRELAYRSFPLQRPQCLNVLNVNVMQVWMDQGSKAGIDRGFLG